MKLLWILLLSTCCFAINSRTGWTSAYVRDSFQDSGLVAGGTVKATTNGKLILGVPDTAGKCYRASTADTVTSWIEWAKIHGAPSIPAAYDSAGHAGISDSSKKYDNRYQATLTNPVTGAGTSGFFPLWSGTTTLGNSVAKQISTIDVTVKANFADTGNTYISGFLGIGQAPSSNYGALINQTSTYTGSGDVCGVYGGMAYTPSSTGGSLYGLNFSPSLLGTNSTIRVVGVLGNVVINAGSGACGDIIPNRSALTITGSSARTFTNFYGMKLDITNAGPALTGTNAYQLYLNDYSSALTATNHYGIFQNATALPNVLYSATAIGEVGGSATTPYANLHVMDLSAGAGIKNAIQISGGNTNTGDGVGIMFNHYYGSTAYYNWQAAQLSAGYSAVPAGGYGTTFILKTNTGAGLNTLDTVFSGNTVSMVIKPSLTLRSLATGRPYSTAGVISIAALTAAEMPDSSASTKFHNVKVDSLFAVTGIKSTNGYHGGPADTTINAKRAVFADSSTNTHKADTAINCKYAVKSDSSRASHVSDTSLKTDNRYLGLHNTADSAKSSGQAAKLITSRTIGGTSFDGTGNIVPDTTNKAHTVNGGQVVSDTFNNHGTVIDKKGNVWLSGQAMEIGCGDSIYPHPSDVELFSSVYNVGSPYPFNENETK